MYSFYGGRPGNSFVIITSFRSIADMIAQFSKGPNYTAVHYDEHVIINTDNKNNPDNGKIFRRGYNFNNEMGGAEYVGTIVGPSGGAPMLEMSTIANIKNRYVEEDYNENLVEGEYKVSQNDLVPGKIGMGTTAVYNDEIKWACCAVRDENGENTTAYIGFSFPYSVIEFESNGISPYSGGQYADTSSVTRVDDLTHPFYEKWHINIPKGVKGESIKNLKVETASSTIDSYPGQADDIANNREVLVYEYYNYDIYENGDPKKVYLGDYNVIKNISLDEDGTIVIEYSHSNNDTFTKALKWIDSVSLDTENGELTIVYNQSVDKNGDPTTYTTSLDWIKNIEINPNGTVIFKHTSGEDEVSASVIKWINSISLSEEGALSITYNDGTITTLNQIIKWIKDIHITPLGQVNILYNDNPNYIPLPNTRIKWVKDVDIDDDGTVTINYNDESSPTILTKKLKWINSADITPLGDLQIKWNDNSTTIKEKIFKWIQSISIGNTGTITINWNNNSLPTSYPNLMKWINSVAINTGETEGSGNQKLQITWNNDANPIEIGNPINYVMNMAVNQNNHLLVRYSDPVRRTAGGVTYNNLDGWTDLGNISLNYFYNDEDIVENLNWIGTGLIIDDGTNNKRIKFNISPALSVNPEINTALVSSGILNGSNGTDSISGFDISENSVTEVLFSATGLNFDIETNITSDGTASSNFINLSIENMTLQFSNS